jgi:hypothetical protein
MVDKNKPYEYQSPEESSAGSDEFSGNADMSGVPLEDESRYYERQYAQAEESMPDSEIGGGEAGIEGLETSQDYNPDTYRTSQQKETERQDFYRQEAAKQNEYDKKNVVLFTKIFKQESEPTKQARLRQEALDRQNKTATELTKLEQKAAIEEAKKDVQFQKTARDEAKWAANRQKAEVIGNIAEKLGKAFKGGKRSSTVEKRFDISGMRNPKFGLNSGLKEGINLSGLKNPNIGGMKQPSQGDGLQHLRNPNMGMQRPQTTTSPLASTGTSRPQMQDLSHLRQLSMPSNLSPIAQKAYQSISGGKVNMQSTKTMSADIAREESLPPAQSSNAVKELIQKRILQKGGDNNFEVIQ